ncbi:MAG: radical SAM protein [Magnetococcales bacterium]|nr:radical SAM protein [Magnetococcales bacterium]
MNTPIHRVDPNLWQHAARLRRRYSPSKRLLLVQAPQFLFENINLDVIRNQGYYAFPPTGLQWLAESLQGRGFEIEIYDLNHHLLEQINQDHLFDPADWLSLLDHRLEQFEPSLVGITCLSVSTDLFGTYHPLTAMLRHISDKQRYITLAGGCTASNEASSYLHHKLVHYIVEGEGERCIQSLMDALFNEQDGHTPTQGIHFLDGEDLQSSTGRAQSVVPQGNLVATYSQIPVESYHRVGSLNPYSRMRGRDVVYGVVHLNRGCRANCKFCGVRAFMGEGIRTHPDRDLRAEVRYLVEERGVRHLEVLDDDFLFDLKAVTSLLEELASLKNKGYNLSWAANNGLIAASITPELLELMRASGCIGFKIGIESGNGDKLKEMRKPGSPTVFQRVADQLKRYPEFFVGGSYIIGLFGKESFGEILDTFLLAQKLQLDWAAFSLFQYTSSANNLAENMKADVRAATDFMPAKDSASRTIQEDPSIPLGPEVFLLPKEKIPSREQLRNIWMTFNMYSNYIGHPSLRRGRDCSTLSAWLESILHTYPSNPYIHLFSGLCHLILGQKKQAAARFERSRALVAAHEPMWSYRFARFGLDQLLEPTPPRNPDDVYDRLEAISQRYTLHFTAS